jgi:hypothetical protein
MSDAVAENHSHETEENVDTTTVPLLLLAAFCLTAFVTLAGPPDTAASESHGQTAHETSTHE